MFTPRWAPHSSFGLRFYSTSTSCATLVGNRDPSRGTLHEILSTVPLPAGAQPQVVKRPPADRTRGAVGERGEPSSPRLRLGPLGARVSRVSSLREFFEDDAEPEALRKELQDLVDRTAGGGLRDVRLETVRQSHVAVGQDPEHGEGHMGAAVYTTPVAHDGVLYVLSRNRLFALAEGAERRTEKTSR